MFKEFKNFAMRGNVLDLAIGIIIGGAFGKIVSSLVGDIIMPVLGVLLGRVNFSSLQVTMASGIAGAPPVAIMYGKFIQSVVDFLIIAVVIFVMIKAVNHFHRREEKAPTPSGPSKEEILLTEIRDALRDRP